MEEGQSSRKKQVKAIISNKVLDNKTYAQVTAILGPEDLLHKNDTVKTRVIIEYILGTYYIDFDRLAIRFKEGIVDSVYRYHD